ncbi:LacI family DNA-binding transcriptional regulator [Pseudactinotalea suaedae]|uniref:LacI family DNA-binding transcriptional regulator n=1 Tax=Pseudactinotalea suaedae TaxID=1524924 RepID=UPI0012E2C48F|nr:LacI family DNA-binding transcriptional regulator [Pseudactinotalea suaedae]
MTTRVTLEHVAARASVSRQTVSNVINSPDIVKAATKQRVEQAIAELGYRPHAAARQLVTRRSHVLGFAVPPSGGGTRYPVDSAFLHALTEAAQREGYRIMLFTAGTDAEEISEYRHLLDGSDLDGFVLAHTHHGDPRTSWLAEHGVPFVTFGRPWGHPDVSHHWVDVDGAAGTRAAVEHLAEAGHVRIAFIGWPTGSGVGDDRRDGWARALAERGRTAGEIADWQAVTLDSVEAAAAPVRALLERVRPTALVCVSDSVAVAALRVTAQLGADVAIVGFDDAPVAEPLGLSSLRQPLAEAAARCLDLVLRPRAEPHQVLLAPALIVRASSGTARHPLATPSPTHESLRTP